MWADTPKKIACCSRCDRECFEIEQRKGAEEESHLSPGERTPIRFGKPYDFAMRAEFVMVSGSIMDITFCEDCLASLSPSDYLPLWHRVLLGWGKHEWVATQLDNGLLGIRSVRRWKDIPR